MNIQDSRLLHYLNRENLFKMSLNFTVVLLDFVAVVTVVCC